MQPAASYMFAQQPGAATGHADGLRPVSLHHQLLSTECVCVCHTSRGTRMRASRRERALLATRSSSGHLRRVARTLYTAAAIVWPKCVD